MKFSPGDAVLVRPDWPEAGDAVVHIRTPHYLRGRPGTVVRYMGDYRNPEDLAFGREAQAVPLYLIEFRQNGLWPDAPETDGVLVEVYEHWLEHP